MEDGILVCIIVNLLLFPIHCNLAKLNSSIAKMPPLYVQVCERSLSGSGGGQSAGSPQQFVRAEMLPSGYLVRPCEGGGSIVHIVDHLDLEV
jgi:hypothetical protein